jgi:hypothetical protein
MKEMQDILNPSITMAAPYSFATAIGTTFVYTNFG